MPVLTPPWRDALGGELRSPLLGAAGFVAGFSTRADGSMAGSFDQLDVQARNREVLARRLGFDGVVRIKQVHGNAVVRVEGPADPWPTADAVWTARRGVLLGVAAADCVPVLVADPRSGRCGAAHAGWQGTRLRVAQALVRAMVGAGSRPSELLAAIGPSIGPCCYTIDEGRAELIRTSGQAGHLREGGAEVRFDLWSANAAQLRDLGVSRIEVAAICTKSGGLDLWSYRARDADGRYGTQLGFIGRPA